MRIIDADELIRRCMNGIDNEFIGIVNEMPTLEQEPKWIPVSEGFPETNDDVLVYDGYYIFIAWNYGSEKGHRWDSCDDYFVGSSSIIAWMPLPEPYKAESEE